jgi:hypothetical protein
MEASTGRTLHRHWIRLFGFSQWMILWFPFRGMGSYAKPLKGDSKNA